MGDMKSFEYFLKTVKSIVIDSLSGNDSPISDSDMVLKLLDLFPSEDKPLKETILSKCPLPTFEEACYMVYKYKLGQKKDPERPIRTDPRTPKIIAPAVGTTDPRTPKNIAAAAETAKTLGDVVDTAGKLGDVVNAVGNAGVPIGHAVSSVASVAGAVGPLGLPIKALSLVILAGCKIWQRRSRN